MKALSRKKARITIIALAAGLALIVLALILHRFGVHFAILLWPPALASLMAAALLMSSANRCPHCHTRVRGLYWSRADAGQCEKCGRTLYYDDSLPK